MKGRFIAAADWILPVAGPPIPEGALLLEEGRVLDIGPAGALARRHPGLPATRLPPGAVMPGLVNAHAHLELSFLPRLPAGEGFAAWAARVIAAREQGSGEERAERLRLAVREMKACGTAYVADVSNTLESVPVLEKEGLSATVFREFLGTDPFLARELEAWLEETSLESPPAGREEGRRRNPARDPGRRPARGPSAPARGWEADRGTAAGRGRAEDRGPFRRVRLLAAVHAPFTASRALLRACRDGAAARGAPWSLHVAESRDEMALFATGKGPLQELLLARGVPAERLPPAGTRPTAFLEDLGLLDERLVAVHLVHIDEEEIRLLALRGVKPCLCPSSNLHLAGGLAPWSAMIAAGLKPSLGTDGTTSGESLNLFREMEILLEAGGAPAIILKMGTVYGAEALGLGPGFGRIEKGEEPEMIHLAFPKAPGSDPAAEAILSGAARRITRLRDLIGGKD